MTSKSENDRAGAHPLATATPPDDDERTIEIRDAVNPLTPDLRELICLIHGDGFSITDVSDIIGIPNRLREPDISPPATARATPNFD